MLFRGKQSSFAAMMAAMLSTVSPLTGTPKRLTGHSNIDGEYAMTGVDATEIVADTTYELVKTVSEE